MSTDDAKSTPVTVVPYLYRDASNYKVESEAVFVGSISEDQRATLRSALDDGEFLIPSQVGLEDLQHRLGSAPGEDDHCWHVLNVDEIEVRSDRRPTEALSIGEWVALVAQTAWNESAADARLRGGYLIAASPEPVLAGVRMYRTVVAVEVLSDGPLGDIGLEGIAYAITEGDCSGEVVLEHGSEIDRRQAIILLAKQGSDTGFLFGSMEDGPCEDCGVMLYHDEIVDERFHEHTGEVACDPADLA